MSALDKEVFSQVYNYTDCLAMKVSVSLYLTLALMTMGAAYAAGIIQPELWAIILPTPTGYRVTLYREEEKEE